MAKTAKTHPDDAPDLTDAWFAKARPLAEVAPHIAADLDAAQAARRRGKQKAPTKVMLALRIDRAALERWRASGKGWQSRMNDTLAKHAPRTRRAKAARS